MSDSKLMIKVDPRIELLMTVQILSGYNNIVKEFCAWDIMNTSNSQYKERKKAYFGIYRTQGILHYRRFGSKAFLHGSTSRSHALPKRPSSFRKPTPI